ncbi:MAG TPA: sulfotransferase [Polyangium sp.]|nr:sulfotransferase [Polyangium sp.]
MTKTSPLRQRILALPRAERASVLLDAMQSWVAEVTGKAEEEIAPTAHFTAFDASWNDPFTMSEALYLHFDKYLNFPFYLTDLEKVSTLEELAGYVADELDPPPPTVPYVNPHDGGRWPWPELKPYPHSIETKQPMVFLLGVHRSGTTLLRTMLTGHPSLFGPPELYLLHVDSMGEFRAQATRLGNPWYRMGLIQTFAHLENVPFEQAEAKVRRLEDEDTPIHIVYRAIAQLAADRLLVDKTPAYLAHAGWPERAEQIFDQPKYLYLVRHPFAVIESWMRMRVQQVVRNQFGVWDDNPWLHAEKAWAAWNQNALMFLEKIPAARQHLVHYEKLVADPEGTQRAICQFLGIPFDEALLDPYRGERLVNGVGDGNFTQHRQVEARLATAWRDQRPPQELSPFTKQVAAQLGYEV